MSTEPEPPPMRLGPEVMRIKLPVSLKLLADIGKVVDQHFGRGCVFRGDDEFVWIHQPCSSDLTS